MVDSTGTPSELDLGMGKAEHADRSEPLTARLRKSTAPRMVQVAPGIFARQNTAAVPDVTLAYWIPQDDGTYKLLPFTERMVRVTTKLVRMLGFAGQYNTLMRLGEAGFVEIVRIAPNTHLINLDSWFNHVRRCAENTEFWEDTKRLKTYQLVYRRVDLMAGRSKSARGTK